MGACKGVIIKREQCKGIKFAKRLYLMYLSVMTVMSVTRLHEFDQQIQWVREGMARVIPVPLLSLFTGFELETMVSCYSFVFNTCSHYYILINWRRISKNWFCA